LLPCRAESELCVLCLTTCAATHLLVTERGGVYLAPDQAELLVELVQEEVKHKEELAKHASVLCRALREILNECRAADGTGDNAHQNLSIEGLCDRNLRLLKMVDQAMESISTAVCSSLALLAFREMPGSLTVFLF